MLHNEQRRIHKTIFSTAHVLNIENASVVKTGKDYCQNATKRFHFLLLEISMISQAKGRDLQCFTVPVYVLERPFGVALFHLPISGVSPIF